MIPFMLFFMRGSPLCIRGEAGVAKEVVEKVSAASGSTSVYSKIDYSMSLLPFSFSFYLY